MTIDARRRAPRLLGLAMAISVVLAAGACSPDLRARGNNPTDDRLAQIEPGKQTRREVASLLGSPSTTATFDSETWFYISAQTRQYAIFKREEMERRIIAITFDEGGTVKTVRELTLEDGRDIAMLGRETPTMGNEMGILEQLMGNLGRFEERKTTTIPGL
ncbi:outer membrane protein assembly factor BamE [Roseospira visakhapatnamensis]|uniref:Outer membrane protein assembly factor BamE (Lipoprotein component of BamABCDE complex) n=1 Tax=Roseospira visakhapatnamensis TaxID=390880 RepID=A0A7W6WAH9_9PROT|nr:outer membrane protein assembly factor BamE [Roseospira visakhapatnamensis]MBB4266989.1 outer membrane protein assembly factor BamE (lipoprotein component of BamABCDE complex) [Roseospira visakhapatnamensis]